MKVFIPIPVWKRPEIFLQCLIGMNRFIKKSKKYRIDVLPFFILSPDDYYFQINEFMINAFDFEYCVYKNLPVGEKMNAGINLGMDLFNFDYLMNCGSDNIINPEIWDEYKPLMKNKRQFFGLRNFYCYGTVEDEAIYFDNYNKERAIGTARMIHHNILKTLEKKNLNLYLSANNSGLDTCSGNIILENCRVKEYVINTDYPYTLGLKSATNINPFPHILRRKEKITNIEFKELKPYFYD